MIMTGTLSWTLFVCADTRTCGRPFQAIPAVDDEQVRCPFCGEAADRVKP